MGARHPWTSEIYGFQGVFRTQRVLTAEPSHPGKKKKITPWTNS